MNSHLSSPAEYGVGIIGYGFIGRVHALAHRSLSLLYDPLPANTRLVGVATATAQSGEKAMRQAGFEFATLDYAELLARPDIRLVHICTPNDTHRQIVLDALKAGKHIYCDKPLALNTGEAEEIVEAGRHVPQVQQMTFNYRFIPALLRARELAESGFLGDLFSFRGAYLHAGYVNPDRPFSWRLDRSRSGGGAVADLGAHLIDLVRFLVGPGAGVARGGEFTKVRGALETVIRERPDPAAGAPRRVDVDDMAFAQCRLAGGAVGTLEASRLATGAQDELRLELHGSRGAMRFNLMDPNWLEVYDATLPEAPLGGNRGFTRLECVSRYPRPFFPSLAKNSVGWMNFHTQSIYEFLCNAVRVDAGEAISSITPTFQDGLAAQRVIDAIQEPL